MNDTGAVTPQMDPIISIFGKMQKEQEGTFDALKEYDEKLKQLGNSLFWEILEEKMDKLCNTLDDLEGQAFENGASLQEIGLRRAVNRLVKANLNSFKAKVNGTNGQLNRPAQPGAAVSR